MAHYVISEIDMDKLIELGVADRSVHWLNGEMTFIEMFRFGRDHTQSDWVGPFTPRPLLEEILIANGMEIETVDDVDEVKIESSLDHFDVDALEEEARHEHSVNTRLNNFED